MNTKIPLVILLILLLGGVSYVIWLKPPDHANQIACTEEAKLCPDGSYVGRTGPMCEFTACPIPPSGASETWSTATDPESGVSFRYPDRLTTQYISTVDWPPRVAVTDGPFKCTETGMETGRAARIEKRMVDNRVYCVTNENDGAAGSTYTSYAYATERDNKVYTFTFTLRAVQCGNYDEPNKTACEQERETFDLDGVVDRMAQSL